MSSYNGSRASTRPYDRGLVLNTVWVVERGVCVSSDNGSRSQHEPLRQKSCVEYRLALERYSAAGKPLGMSAAQSSGAEVNNVPSGETASAPAASRLRTR